jgi:hypothetical protein
VQFIIADKAREAVGKMWNGIGVETDKELKLEDGEASHTPCTGWGGGTETFDMPQRPNIAAGNS